MHGEMHENVASKLAIGQGGKIHSSPGGQPLERQGKNLKRYSLAELKSNSSSLERLALFDDDNQLESLSGLRSCTLCVGRLLAAGQFGGAIIWQPIQMALRCLNFQPKLFLAVSSSLQGKAMLQSLALTGAEGKFARKT